MFITDRGRPAHVLLSIEDYNRLSSRRLSIADLLDMPGGAEIAFEPPKLGDAEIRPADFD